MRRTILATTCIAVSLGTSGCTEYLARRDGLDYGAGNAVNTNIVTHVIDPWPRVAASTDPTTNGERSARAVERYRTTQASGSAAPPSAQAVIGAANVGVSGAAGLR